MRLAHTQFGRRVVDAILRDDPLLAREPLVRHLTRPARFKGVDQWPRHLVGFEDLAFLFSSNNFNFGLALLSFDEAAYLFRLTRELGPATIVEIGRYKGGSTVLLAAAMDRESHLYSYDLHVKLQHEVSGLELDAETKSALARYGLAERVNLIVADSTTAPPPAEQCDLIFVDGDHTYSGVRRDYENWRPFVPSGGHLLFQDAASVREFTSWEEDVARLVAEIESEDGAYFVRRATVGSIVHFVRTDAVAPWAQP